jgi:sensor histidine kinase YesM
MEKCMKKNINPLNWKTALAFSIVIALFANAVNTFVAINSEKFLDWDLCDILRRSGWLLILSTSVLFLLYMFAFKIIQMPLKTHVKTIVIIGGIFLLIAGIGTFLFFIIVSANKVETVRLPLLFQIINKIIVSVIIWSSTSQIYLTYVREQMFIENERLISENIRNRYEALKNQIDPHFLFNSLNTLNGLITFDNNRAREYVEKLSSVFRYVIQNKDITTLRDEMNFTNSYAYLINIRYGENFRIDTVISEKYLSYKVMPISVQLLIENAIKHNVISKKYPLTVNIYTTETDTLVVENNIQVKEFSSASSGIGLANLCERYKLLFNKEVVISNTDNIFRIEIPLIKNDKIKI